MKQWFASLLPLFFFYFQNTVFAQDVENRSIEERLARVERILDALTLTGFIRARGNVYHNFDLDKNSREDNHNDFVDLRSFLTFKAVKNSWSAEISIDAAGNDFNDGAILGYDDPGKNRPIEVDLRYAFIQYREPPLFLRLGRQPSRLGHSIVSNTIRDIGKIGWMLDGFSIEGVWVKGAEGITQTSSGVANSRRVIGASNGDDQDLDAAGLVINVPSLLNESLKLQLYTIRKFETSSNSAYEEHHLTGISLDAVAPGNFSWSFEFNYMSGKTRNGRQGAETDERADIHAAMAYLDGTYSHGGLSGGLACGYGTGDNDPTDKDSTNFPNFFMDETGFAYTFIFSDDIHGYDGRSSDNDRGSGFANITWLQGHLKYAWNRLEVSTAYTLLRATKPQKAGSGSLGEIPTASSARTRDVGSEIDGEVAYDISEFVRGFGKAGAFFPGEIYGGADAALKAEIGLEFRF